MSGFRSREIFEPLQKAFNGFVYAFRTQRHMRFHIYVVLAVVLLSLFFGFRLRETEMLLFTVCLVLFAEMFNSAIEATVDLAHPTFHPLAKFAKDISAGAVLITTIIALVIGSLLILGENRWELLRVNLTAETAGPGFLQRFIAGSLLVFLTVVIGKGLGKRGRVLRGGMVSGHAAVGFFFAGSIMALTDSFMVAGIAILLAGLVAQSRFEAKIHSVFELTLGAAAGVVIALLVFGLSPK